MLDYDMPLYRPPSEGQNLIIQATLGCSFNHCTFCSMYRSKQFSVPPLAEVERQIHQAAALWPDAHRVFLADGDALILPTDHLLALLERLQAALPDLARVSAYATPVSLLRKTPEALKALRAAKLSLVYLGIESGDGEMLRRIAKGATPRSMIAAINRAEEHGLKVSATVILGLGGEAHWQQHIDGTCTVINAAPPTYLSTLQLYLDPAAEPVFLEKFGEPFQPQSDAAILDELNRLIQGLAPPRPIIFRSNHASNALPLAGTLPKDQAKLQAAIEAAKSGTRDLRPRWLRGL